MKNKILLFVSVFLVLLALLIGRRAEAPTEPNSLLSELPTREQSGPTLTVGNRIISLLLAKTEAERELGLGDREAIREDEGMLFVFPKGDRYGIWMKNMRFPLDIVWLSPSSSDRQELIVLDMQENVAVETYPKVFYPKTDARYVLEVNAGAAKKFGIGGESVLTLKE